VASLEFWLYFKVEVHLNWILLHINKKEIRMTQPEKAEKFKKVKLKSSKNTFLIKKLSVDIMLTIMMVQNGCPKKEQVLLRM